MKELQIYDEFTLTLHALQGLADLVSGCANMIEPGRLGPLLSPIVERFCEVQAAMELLQDVPKKKAA
jgi:hypothetical protein